MDTWIAPRAADIAGNLGKVAAVSRLLGDEAAARMQTPGAGRWPLLFFAVWSLIHLEGATPREALAAVCPG